MQFIRRRLLQYIAARTGPECFADGDRFREHRDKDNLDGWKQFFQLLGRREPAETGHAGVQQDDIRTLLQRTTNDFPESCTMPTIVK